MERAMSFDEARAALDLPDHPTTKLTRGKGPTPEENAQTAQRLASGYLEHSVHKLGELVDNPDRYSQVQIAAIKLILELATATKPTDSPAEGSKTYIISNATPLDRTLALEEYTKRHS